MSSSTTTCNPFQKGDLVAVRLSPNANAIVNVTINKIKVNKLMIRNTHYSICEWIDISSSRLFPTNLNNSYHLDTINNKHSKRQTILTWEIQLNNNHINYTSIGLIKKKYITNNAILSFQYLSHKHIKLNEQLVKLKGYLVVEGYIRNTFISGIIPQELINLIKLFAAMTNPNTIKSLDIIITNKQKINQQKVQIIQQQLNKCKMGSFFADTKRDDRIIHILCTNYKALYLWINWINTQIEYNDISLSLTKDVNELLYLEWEWDALFNIERMFADTFENINKIKTEISRLKNVWKRYGYFIYGGIHSNDNHLEITLDKNKGILSLQIDDGKDVNHIIVNQNIDTSIDYELYSMTLKNQNGKLLEQLTDA